MDQPASAAPKFLMNHRAGDLDSVTSGDSWRTLVASEMGETTQAGRLFQRWRDSFSTNWRTSGRQVETRKRTPSQRDRQQTGTAQGGTVIGLPARLSSIQLIYWRKSISSNVTLNYENRDA